ncbi:tRNA (adenosine(37)-N6)-threonylcarbamoyltransferase complex dimerization subunit type 1 TsaB, partial [Georgenia sp. 10Sc9-8]|nr:tRNA (adenosine(37)-N6)-threonylcarbamoyltransferase complex dimerization subunit type 1 TsaB [Georgenia halotolerans]
MLTLCLDTSAGTGVALVGDGVLASATTTDPRRHAETLAPMVHRVLEEARVARRDLQAVVAGTGPAPFTGLRVGLVTARTLARGLGVPVHGVSSLDALARQALDADGSDEVVVVTDARRREVYWARYRSLGDDDVERLTGPHVQPP